VALRLEMNGARELQVQLRGIFFTPVVRTLLQAN